MVLADDRFIRSTFVKKRIDKEFPSHEFLVNDITVHIEPKVTVSEL